MRQYEVMVILDPDLDERSITPTLDGFLKVIRDLGGSIEKNDVWGRRRLAYEIKTKSGKKVAEGIYAVVDVRATPDAVKEFDRQANLSETVVRTKVIRPDQR
ncbi:30S ribosomal protein S6 [Catenulispora subtropica]|uniref:Small ribosomal subunit protein bS6 n=1 Tax=Catenulispora subtropica TaxID=450798 RepID=A0ABN2QDR3_9ACTN